MSNTTARAVMTARRPSSLLTLRYMSCDEPVCAGEPGWREITGIQGAGRSRLGARAAPAGQGASNATGPCTRSIIHCSRAPPSGNSSSASGLLRGGSPRRNHVTKDVIIKSTHRGLRCEDGRLTVVLEAGRYEVPERRLGPLGGSRTAVEILGIYERGRELAIQGPDTPTSIQVEHREFIIVKHP